MYNPNNMKSKFFLLIVVVLFVVTACENEEKPSSYSKSSFVGEWKAYKKRIVIKNSASGEIRDDNTNALPKPYIINLKNNGIAIIDNDYSNSCQWELVGDKLNVGCSDFYKIDEYSPVEFVLSYSLRDKETIIDNYIYYSRIK